jgi:hypothetical protein
VVWFASVFVFYGFYEPYQAWYVTRYLLPGMPAMIAGAFLTARDWLVSSRPRVAVALAMLGVVLFVSARSVRRLDILEAWRGEEVYPEACRFAAGEIPASAVVLSMQMSGALRFYTSLTPARWDWIDARRFPALRTQIEARAAGGTPSSLRSSGAGSEASRAVDPDLKPR